MSTLPVTLIGAPVLRQKAAPVVAFDAALRVLVEGMFETMYAEGGQGLAAPQVDHSMQLAVVDVPPTGPPYVLINPRIASASTARARGIEGCLSIPGVWGRVERPAGVVVEALDMDGQALRLEAEGELARCLQHEIDHLNGILYIDHLGALERRMLMARYRKLLQGGRSGERELKTTRWS